MTGSRSSTSSIQLRTFKEPEMICLWMYQGERASVSGEAGFNPGVVQAVVQRTGFGIFAGEESAQRLLGRVRAGRLGGRCCLIAAAGEDR